MKTSQYLSIKISCKADFIEILIAELSMLNYNSMMEIDGGLEAYIEKEQFDEDHIKELQSRYKEAEVTYSIDELIEKNWNEEWEKNYDPIQVDDTIMVRATFHDRDPNYKYDLLITPKMSFGTGHHATTHLMLKHQLEIDHEGKRVLDAGCGTAILAVMAEKLGATEILAYDIDSWSIENAPENVKLNGCQHVEVQSGTIRTVDTTGLYDVILANINKNVLLDELPLYVERLKTDGKIILSGFYVQDNEDIVSRASECNLALDKGSERHDWSSLIFHKN